MTNSRQKRLLTQAVLTGALTLLATSQAGAVTFQEYPDAGQLPGTAQNTSNLPGLALGAIRGTLTGNGNGSGDAADLYRIFLNVGTSFSASTGASDYNFNNFNTALYLFDDHGRGLVASDDTSSFGPQSLLNFDPSYTGLYYLAISGSGYVPTSGGSEIFPGLFFATDQIAADPSAGSLSGWTGVSSEGDAYEIVLTGAQTVPEPETMLLVALALAGLAYSRRRA